MCCILDCSDSGPVLKTVGRRSLQAPMHQPSQFVYRSFEIALSPVVTVIAPFQSIRRQLKVIHRKINRRVSPMDPRRQRHTTLVCCSAASAHKHERCTPVLLFCICPVRSVPRRLRTWDLPWRTSLGGREEILALPRLCNVLFPPLLAPSPYASSP